MHAVRVDVLDQARFAAGLVDRIHRQRVLARSVGRAIGDIDAASVRMHVHRADRLATNRRTPQRGLAIARRRRQRAIRPIEQVERVLPFKRHIDPWLRQMKIQMPRPEAIPTVGCDRYAVAQHAVVEVEQLQRARFFRLAVGGVMAAADQDYLAIVRRRTHLVREDARIDRARLRDFGARAAIGIDPIDADRAGVVERHQDVARWNIGRHVNRSRRQRDGRSMLAERPRCSIDAQRRHVMIGARRPHPGRAVAGRDIKKLPRCMRPGVLHIRQQTDGVAARQRRRVDVDIILRQLRSDIGVQPHLVRHLIAPMAGR